MADRKKRKSSKSQTKKEEMVEIEQPTVSARDSVNEIQNTSDNSNNALHFIQKANHNEHYEMDSTSLNQKNNDIQIETTTLQKEHHYKQNLENKIPQNLNKNNCRALSTNSIPSKPSVPNQSIHQLIDNTFDHHIKKILLIFHFSHEFSTIPSYIKISVIFDYFYEKMEQIFADYMKLTQKAEAQFIMDMNIYFNFLSLNFEIANQMIQFKKILFQKIDTTTQAKRAADMAKTFHKFLKKNQGHWGS